MHTSSSAWAFELAQLEAEVRERLGDLAPPKLRFAPGPLPEAITQTPETPAASRLETTAEDRRAAAELTRGIGDEKLRNLVARAAAASLATDRSRRSV